LEEQEERLELTLELVRILYNFCLLDRNNHYEQTGKGLTRIRQQDIMAADRFRFLPVNEVRSQDKQEVLFGRSGLPGTLPAPE
jgi:hypothetical protein